jgi:LPXTG-site transpeptidase (sortase) family protein
VTRAGAPGPPSVAVEHATPRRSDLSGPVQGRPPGRAKPQSRQGHGRPRSLHIASLDVHAPVVPIDADERVLLPPANPATVGWWRDGAVPGAAYGSAVITGHTVSTGGGAFDDLDRLRPGAGVTVRTGQGTLDYVVRNVLTYRKGLFARQAPRLLSQSVPGRLVLVTCEDWNGEIYLSNQVVIAVNTP